MGGLSTSRPWQVDAGTPVGQEDRLGDAVWIETLSAPLGRRSRTAAMRGRLKSRSGSPQPARSDEHGDGANTSISSAVGGRRGAALAGLSLTT